MSIEYRAMLTKEMEFQSGTKLPMGTVIYVEPTEAGWIGSFWPDQTRSTTLAFALDADDFSIFHRGDSKIEEVIVVPSPAAPTDEDLRAQELAQRRLRARVRVYREEADRLERLLATGDEP